jgi:bifunctional DNA primase/polymerase-like protein
MTPLDQALAYAASGTAVFPCKEQGLGRKRPYTGRGFYDASRDPLLIKEWWLLWPAALIGIPTGRTSGRVVLDIDVKNERANGFDTLDDLGIVLPATPMAHTASGSLHVYFGAGDRELKNSAGLIGPGLDVRGDGGYVIAPSLSSGYHWDPHWNFGALAMAPAPNWLWPPELSCAIWREPVKPVDGLSPYGHAAIESACNAIVSAGPGEQECRRALRQRTCMAGALRNGVHLLGLSGVGGESI